MLANYGYIGLFLAVAILFAAIALLIPFFLSLPSRLRDNSRIWFIPLPSFVVKVIRSYHRFSRLVPWNPDPVKTSTYECGMETIGKAWVQFNFRYYFYALLFVVLDVLVIFLYPWAVELRRLGLFAFIALLIFVGIVVVGYIYAWRKKVLEWK